jgi:hypothetical protein
LALFVAVRYLRPPVLQAQKKVGAVEQARRRGTGLREGDRTVRVLKVGLTPGDLTLMINRDRLARSVRPRIAASSRHGPVAVPRSARLDLQPFAVDTIVEAGAHPIFAAAASTGGAAALWDLTAELGRSEGAAPEPREGD